MHIYLATINKIYHENPQADLSVSITADRKLQCYEHLFADYDRSGHKSNFFMLKPDMKKINEVLSNKCLSAEKTLINLIYCLTTANI